MSSRVITIRTHDVRAYIPFDDVGRIQWFMLSTLNPKPQTLNPKP